MQLPARVVRFLARPWAEQKEVYRGWWAYAKKEARHYWVRWCCLTCAAARKARAPVLSPNGGRRACSWAPSCWARTSRSPRAWSTRC